MLRLKAFLLAIFLCFAADAVQPNSAITFGGITYVRLEYRSHVCDLPVLKQDSNHFILSFERSLDCSYIGTPYESGGRTFVLGALHSGEYTLSFPRDAYSEPDLLTELQIHVPETAPTITDLSMLDEGHLSFTLNGLLGIQYEVELSSDLRTWQILPFPVEAGKVVVQKDAFDGRINFVRVKVLLPGVTG